MPGGGARLAYALLRFSVPLRTSFSRGHTNLPSHCRVPSRSGDHRGLFVSPDLFREQLAWLKSHRYKSVSLDAVIASVTGGKPLPARWVSLTFDDGWRDNYTAALPALQEYGFGATVFLITDRVARNEPLGRWDDYLTASDITEMQAQGIVFGSHTHTHPRLTKLANDAVQFELTELRRRLRDELGVETDLFCYPYGNFSPRIAQLVEGAGYRGGLSTIRDNRPAAHKPYWLPRVMVMNDTRPSHFGYMLSPWYHWLHALKNRRRWKSIR